MRSRWLVWIAGALFAIGFGAACGAETEECLGTGAECGRSGATRCCAGSVCKSNVVETGVSVCLASCSTDADCAGGCCRFFEGDEQALCVSQDFCRR